MVRRAVFIDRDGTLIRDKEYLADPDNIEWFPGVFGALKELEEAGFSLIVVTNQSGVARGYFDEETVQAVNSRFKADLAREGINLTGLYYCPAHPEADQKKYRHNLHRRKPAPGMLKEGAREHKLDLPVSWMVGDKLSDVECGKRAGCRAILVETGKATRVDEDTEYKPDYIAADFNGASRWIIEATDAET